MKKTVWFSIQCLLILFTLFAVSTTGAAQDGGTLPEKVTEPIAGSIPPSAENPCLLTNVICEYEKQHSDWDNTSRGNVYVEPKENRVLYNVTITAYNALEWQTDSSPCVGAGGYICGRSDVVACPRSYALGTRVRIMGVEYVCLDRLSKKYDDRFDIFMGTDIAAARAWGKRTLEVEILDYMPNEFREELKSDLEGKEITTVNNDRIFVGRDKSISKTTGSSNIFIPKIQKSIDKP